MSSFFRKVCYAGCLALLSSCGGSGGGGEGKGGSGPEHFPPRISHLEKSFKNGNVSYIIDVEDEQPLIQFETLYNGFSRLHTGLHASFSEKITQEGKNVLEILVEDANHKMVSLKDIFSIPSHQEAFNFMKGMLDQDLALGGFQGYETPVIVVPYLNGERMITPLFLLIKKDDRGFSVINYVSVPEMQGLDEILNDIQALRETSVDHLYLFPAPLVSEDPAPKDIKTLLKDFMQKGYAGENEPFVEGS